MNCHARGVLLLVLLFGSALPAQAQPIPSTPADASDTSMPSFASLFTKLPSDFGHLPTAANGIVIGSAGAFALAVHPGDRTMEEEVQESLRLEELLDPGTPLGGGVVQGGGAFAMYLVGRFSNRPDIAIVGADLVRAQIVAGALTHSIKALAQRDRPNGGRNSFPSGHSASSFATASVLQRYFGWKAGLPAYGLASYVAAARLSEHQHFLSDVVFGAGIGIIAGRAVTVGHGTHAFAISPIVEGGGFGVSFTKVN